METLLIVDSDDGFYIHRTVPPSQVRGTGEYSVLVEDAVRKHAASNGMPDFVCKPLKESKGNATREIGDGILVVGRTALIIQVKSRKPESERGPEKEKGWLEKHYRTAARQIDGTARNVRRKTTVKLTNLRGHSVYLDPQKCELYGVVVLDHPNPPPIELHKETTTPHTVLTRSEWEFLHEQLRSATAVVGYIKRSSETATVQLGQEITRYHQFALADRDTPARDVDRRLVGRNGEYLSTPLLPLGPLPDEERSAASVIRQLIEEVASCPINAEEEDLRQHALELLDRIPPGMRAPLAERITEKIQNPTHHYNAILVREAETDSQLLVGTTTNLSNDLKAYVRDLTIYRHYELQEIRASSDHLTTLSIILTPSTTHRTGWSTTLFMYTGHLDLTEDEVRILQNRYAPSYEKDQD